MAINEEYIKDTLDRHQRQLDKHEEEIGQLQQSTLTTDLKLGNLCEKLENQSEAIKGQTTVLYWLIGTLFVSLLGFFFVVVQSNTVGL